MRCILDHIYHKKPDPNSNPLKIDCSCLNKNAILKYTKGVGFVETGGKWPDKTILDKEFNYWINNRYPHWKTEFDKVKSIEVTGDDLTNKNDFCLMQNYTTLFHRGKDDWGTDELKEPAD